jgi:hypothetical protein
MKTKNLKHIKMFEQHMKQNTEEMYLFTNLGDFWDIGIITKEQAEYLKKNLPANSSYVIEPYENNAHTIIYDIDGVRTEPVDVLGGTDGGGQGYGEEEIFCEFDIPEGEILCGEAHCNSEVVGVEEYVEMKNGTYPYEY